MRIPPKSQEDKNSLIKLGIGIVLTIEFLVIFWDSVLIQDVIPFLWKNLVLPLIICCIVFYLIIMSIPCKKEDIDYRYNPFYDDFWGTYPIDGRDWSVRLGCYVICKRDSDGHCFVLNDTAGKILEDCTERRKRILQGEYVFDDPRMTIIPTSKPGVEIDKETGRYLCLCVYATAYYYMDLKTGEPVRLCDMQRLGRRVDREIGEAPGRCHLDLEAKKREVAKLHQEMLANTPVELRDKDFWDRYIIAGHQLALSTPGAGQWIIKPVKKVHEKERSA